MAEMSVMFLFPLLGPPESGPVMRRGTRSCVWGVPSVRARRPRGVSFPATDTVSSVGQPLFVQYYPCSAGSLCRSSPLHRRYLASMQVPRLRAASLAGGHNAP
jgi:hypothetical protein